MKTILVTGSNGLLGQKLTVIYGGRQDIRFIATGRGKNRYPESTGFVYEEMDITNKNQVMNVINRYQPDCIIHTAAMTNVDECELKQDECLRQNVDAVRNVAVASAATGAHLIHLSTDFIFDGKDGPYREEAEPNPLSFYGQSKLDAEKIIMEICPKWAIARTVLVYGLVADMSRSNIMLWAKDALEKKKAIKVVNDQFRTPTLAEDLAVGCSLIEAREATGIFNISGKDFMSIYELVERVASYFGLEMDHVEQVNSLTLSQPAKRPPVTGFDISKARKVLGYEPHSFEDGIAIVQAQFDKFSNGGATL